MPVRVFTSRRSVVYAAVCAVLAAAPLTAQAAPAASSVPTVPAVQAAALSAPDTAALARASGRPVEVVLARTAVSQLFANPNGSMTLDEFGSTRFVKRGAAWVTADAALVRAADGSFSPRAAGAGVRISGGGTGALAVISGASGSLSLSWPGRLPVPVVSGPAALYREVLPGVDLQVTVTTAGTVDESLIVKDARGAAQAQAASEDLGLSVSSGLVAKVDASGALRMTARKSGAVVFSSPTPSAWDSTGKGSSTLAPGRTARQAKVSVRLDGSGEHLATAASLLRGRDVHYPVYIDPEYTVGPGWQNYGWVESEDPTGGSWDTGTPGVGFDGDGVQRTFWQTEIPAALTGATIISASMGYQVESATSAAATDDTLELYAAGPLSGDLTWDAQSAPAYGPASSSFTTASTAPDLQESFDVTSLIQDEVDAGANSWLAQVENADESTNAHFVQVTGYPSLTVTYDPTPSAVYGVQLDPVSYPSGGGTYTSSLTPTLESVATDSDGAPLAYQFQVLQNGTVLESGTSAFVALDSSALGQWQVTTPLTDATTYQVQVRAYDGTVYGLWSSPVTFTTDVAAPPAPTVSCASYPQNTDSPWTAAGSACTFTDAQSTLNGYVYALTDPAGTTTWAWAADGTATVAPAGPGPYTLAVYAQNDGGVNGPTTDYAFTLTQAPTFTSAATAQLTAGVAGSFTVTTSGYPDATLTETGSLPSGLTFTDDGDGTATISGTPAAGTTGSYPVTLTADNGIGTSATQPVTIVVTDALALTAMGVWQTADPVTSAPMDCVLWQVTGGSPDTLDGQIHYELESTATGSSSQASTDWTITYTASGSYTGTTGAYSWCADTAVLPVSPAGEEWAPVSFTANNGQGATLALTASALSGLSATDPKGVADSDAFTVAG